MTRINTIDCWHLVFAGFLQDEGEATGCLRLYREMHGIFASSGCAVELCEWNRRVDPIATRIARLTNGHLPIVCLYGYSWGGQTAVNLSWELARRGFVVRHMVLCDAVRRHRYWLGNWRAFWPGSKVVVGPTVLDVEWFVQHNDWPRGHEVVAAEKSRTRIAPPHNTGSVTHAHMDEYRPWIDCCLDVAAAHTP